MQALSNIALLIVIVLVVLFWMASFTGHFIKYGMTRPESDRARQRKLASRGETDWCAVYEDARRRKESGEWDDASW